MGLSPDSLASSRSRDRLDSPRDGAARGVPQNAAGARPERPAVVDTFVRTTVDNRALPAWMVPATEPRARDELYFELAPGTSVQAGLEQASATMERLPPPRKQRLVSHKKPANFGFNPLSRQLLLGNNEIGCYTYNGVQRIITRPGKYPQEWLWRRWDVRRAIDVQQTRTFRVGPVSVLRPTNNSVAVAQDLDGNTFISQSGVNRIMVGSYRLVAQEIQPNDLLAGLSAEAQRECTCIEEKVPSDPDKTKRVLGYVRHVREQARDPASPVAALFVQVMPNCVAVLCRHDEWAVLGQGSYIITAKDVNVQRFYTKSASTCQLPRIRVSTADPIQVEINLYMMVHLEDPERFARETNFPTPMHALQNGIEATINSVVSSMYYQETRGMKEVQDVTVANQQRAKLAKDIQARAAEALHKKAAEMGIHLTALEIRHLEVNGDIVAEMDRMARENLINTNTSATLHLRNENEMRQNDYNLQLAQKEAATRQAQATGQANAATAIAEGERAAAIKKAEGMRQAAILTAEGHSEGAKIKASGDLRATERQADGAAYRVRIAAQADVEAATLAGQAVRATAEAEAYRIATEGEAYSGWQAGALRVRELQAMVENTKHLSAHMQTVFLPTQADGRLDPLLSAVLSGSLLGRGLDSSPGEAATQLGLAAGAAGAAPGRPQRP